MLDVFPNAAPRPSADDAVPLPTSVASVPLGNAKRMRWPEKSAMYKPPDPLGSRAMPRGPISRPTPSGPSANPPAAWHTPATVATPACVMRRTQKRPESAMYTTPVKVALIEVGAAAGG